jgi:hypothetical protein
MVLSNGFVLAISAAAGLFIATTIDARAESGTGMLIKNKPFKVSVITADKAAPASPAATPSTAATSDACPDNVYPVDQTMAMIRSEAQRQGLDERLALAVAERESGFGANNNSDAGARGPMQLIPSAAHDYNVQDVCDYKQNVKGGISYLKALWGEFDGNVFLIVAAYNAGKKNVYKAKGIPDIGETVRYVSEIANSYYGYRNTLQHSRLNPPVVPQQQAQADAMGEDEVLPVNGDVLRMQRPQNQWIGGTVLYVNRGNFASKPKGE